MSCVRFLFCKQHPVLISQSIKLPRVPSSPSVLSSCASGCPPRVLELSVKLATPWLTTVQRATPARQRLLCAGLVAGW